VDWGGNLGREPSGAHVGVEFLALQRYLDERLRADGGSAGPTPDVDQQSNPRTVRAGCRHRPYPFTHQSTGPRIRVSSQYPEGTGTSSSNREPDSLANHQTGDSDSQDRRLFNKRTRESVNGHIQHPVLRPMVSGSLDLLGNASPIGGSPRFKAGGGDRTPSGRGDALLNATARWIGEPAWADPWTVAGSCESRADSPLPFLKRVRDLLTFFRSGF
jgi:hypothetical protein